jgi:hypothetical protein
VFGLSRSRPKELRVARSESDVAAVQGQILTGGARTQKLTGGGGLSTLVVAADSKIDGRCKDTRSLIGPPVRKS